MAKAYIFYNPLAGQGQILEDLEALEFVLDEACVLCDMTKPETYEKDLFSMAAEDYLVLCGGDGTLNRFVNILEDIRIPNKILYYPAGTNNDFARDHGRIYGNNPFPVTESLGSLPGIQIGSRTGHFLTAAVFSDTAKKRQYFGKGRGYTEKSTPVSVKVSADKALHHFEKVRFAAILGGRYCQGGLLPDPDRHRTDEELSCVLICGCSRAKAKALLRRMGRGALPHSRYLFRLRGRRISLSFDRPVELHTDGECQSGVTQVQTWRKDRET